MNRFRVRLFFYAHAITALYCVVYHILAGCVVFQEWMIPSNTVFHGLFWSAILFPLTAGLSLIGSGVPHPFRVLSAHIGMGLVQLVFLIPMAS